MSTKILECSSWDDFRHSVLPGLFNPDIPRRGRYYFRGQGSAKHTLISSFDRWYKRYQPAGLNKVEVSKKLLSLFADEASRLHPDPGVSHNEEQLLGLAQHYGVPTRLLDWTETPYVAAFFAFSGIEFAVGDEQIAIWCLDTQSPIWKEDTGIKLLSIPSPYNERLKNQLGKFTLMQSPFDTIEEHLSHCDNTGLTVQKITIPAGEARTALSDLDFMGINYSTIYPGLDGCARAAALRMRIAR